MLIEMTTACQIKRQQTTIHFFISGVTTTSLIFNHK